MENFGAFARISLNDGSKEAYEFTEINRSVSAGVALKGVAWGRGKDTFGIAAVANGLSSAARVYFAAGGLGILIGDGGLRQYGPERILEAYYAATINDLLSATLDYQFLASPGYNGERGPVSMFAARIHAGF